MRKAQNTGGLRHEYKTYKHQKCFVGHSTGAAWRGDLLSACNKVLPKFGLEPWYAADHFDPTKPLRDKVVQLIANARYGIYDLSSWQDKSGQWHLPRNVFIELGMAIAFNRPALLLRHTSNKALPLSKCLEGLDLIEFTGDYTLQKALEKHVPQWLDVPPDRDWLNRFCIFGNRVCNFREEHPRIQQQWDQTLNCHVADGLDKDHSGFQMVEREEIRGIFKRVFGRYSDLAFDYLDEVFLTKTCQFLLCNHCQKVRSTPFAVYRIPPRTPTEICIAIGMSIALETLFEYNIPKVVLVCRELDLPSLLRGYEVVEASSSNEMEQKLQKFIPVVMQKVFVETLVELDNDSQEAAISYLSDESQSIESRKRRAKWLLEVPYQYFFHKRDQEALALLRCLLHSLNKLDDDLAQYAHKLTNTLRESIAMDQESYH